MFSQIIIAITALAIVALATVVNHGVATPEPTNSPQINATSKPSNLPDLTPIPTPVQTPNTQDNDINVSTENTLTVWYYPGSEIAENRAGFLLMTTGDNPSKVTAWYKQKITDLNLNATSVITTTANEKTLNVIAASGNGMDIKVKVSSEGGGSQITVEY